MSTQFGLVQRVLSVPQALVNGPFGPLVAQLQTTLALAAQSGRTWYEIGYETAWDGRTTQSILVYAMLLPADDLAFMNQLARVVQNNGITGVYAWSMHVATFGFPLEIVTSSVVQAYGTMSLTTGGIAVFSVSG
jgi:hypothetical protein